MSSSRTSGDSARAAGKALRHAVRRSFIHALMATDAPFSASTHADLHGIPLSSVTYHARLLVSLGVIEVAETVDRRGGIESRYRLGGPNCQPALAMLPLVDQMSRREPE
jgi:hypothetical protein